MRNGWTGTTFDCALIGSSLAVTVWPIGSWRFHEKPSWIRYQQQKNRLRVIGQQEGLWFPLAYSNWYGNERQRAEFMRPGPMADTRTNKNEDSDRDPDARVATIPRRLLERALSGVTELFLLISTGFRFHPFDPFLFFLNFHFHRKPRPGRWSFRRIEWKN